MLFNNDKPDILDLLSKVQEATTSDVDEERGSFKKGDKVTYDMLGGSLSNSDLIRTLGVDEHAIRVNHNGILAEIVEAMGDEVARYSIMFEDGFVINDVAVSEIRAINEESKVEISRLIKRVPENETAYDKNLDKEYWEFEWSDGTKGEGSLYQSQLSAVRKEQKEKSKTNEAELDLPGWMKLGIKVQILRGGHKGSIGVVKDFSSPEEDFPEGQVDVRLDNGKMVYVGIPDIGRVSQESKTNEAEDAQFIATFVRNYHDTQKRLEKETDEEKRAELEQLLTKIEHRLEKLGYDTDKLFEAEDATQTMKPQEKPDINAEDYHMEDYSEEDLNKPEAKVVSKSEKSGDAIRKVEDKELEQEEDEVEKPKKNESKLNEQIQVGDNVRIEDLEDNELVPASKVISVRDDIHGTDTFQVIKTEKGDKEYHGATHLFIKESNFDEAAKRSRGDAIFQSTHPKVKDDADHFPINDVDQARNALARANQYGAAPKWYDGSLDSLIKTVASAVKKKYPSIEVTKAAKKPGKDGANETVGSAEEITAEEIGLKNKVIAAYKKYREQGRSREEAVQAIVKMLKQELDAPEVRKMLYAAGYPDENLVTSRFGESKESTFSFLKKQKPLWLCNECYKTFRADEHICIFCDSTDADKIVEGEGDLAGSTKEVFKVTWKTKDGKEESTRVMAFDKDAAKREAARPSREITKVKGPITSESKEENDVPFEQVSEGSELQESVSELVGETPGIDVEDQKILRWAIDKGIVSNEWPSEEDMIDQLSSGDMRKLTSEEDAEDVEGLDLGNIKASYVKYVLLPKAIAAYAKLVSEAEIGQKKVIEMEQEGIPKAGKTYHIRQTTGRGWKEGDYKVTEVQYLRTVRGDLGKQFQVEGDDKNWWLAEFYHFVEVNEKEMEEREYVDGYGQILKGMKGGWIHPDGKVEYFKKYYPEVHWDDAYKKKTGKFPNKKVGTSEKNDINTSYIREGNIRLILAPGYGSDKDMTLDLEIRVKPNQSQMRAIYKLIKSNPNIIDIAADIISDKGKVTNISSELPKGWKDFRDAVNKMSVSSTRSESKLKEQEEDIFQTIAKGITDKVDAEKLAQEKEGQVITDEDDDKKFAVIVKE